MTPSHIHQHSFVWKQDISNLEIALKHTKFAITWKDNTFLFPSVYHPAFVHFTNTCLDQGFALFVSSGWYLVMKFHSVNHFTCILAVLTVLEKRPFFHQSILILHLLTAIETWQIAEQRPRGNLMQVVSWVNTDFKQWGSMTHCAGNEAKQRKPLKDNATN